MAPRPKLSREKILRAALRIVDQAGLGGLTTRRLAADLGVTPMAVYRHFENKAEITDGLLEVIIGDAAPSDHQEDDWRAWVLETFMRMYDALVDHPAVIPLLGTSASYGLHALEQMEGVLAVMTKAGMGPEESARSYHLMISYTIGAAAIRSAAGGGMATLRQGALPRDGRLDRSLRDPRAAAFPHVAAVALHLGSFASRDQFRLGVEKLLTSLAPRPG